MFYLKGNRIAYIKVYENHAHSCESCRDFDMNVAVCQQQLGTNIRTNY